MIGGVLGGLACLAILLVAVTLTVRQRARRVRARVAPSAMFTRGRQATPPPPPGPFEPFYQPGISERGDIKSIFSGFSGSGGASLSSKYLSRRDQDVTSPGRDRESWIEPWLPDDKTGGMVKAKDDGVVVTPWVPTMPDDTAALSPMALVEGAVAPTLLYQAQALSTPPRKDSSGTEDDSPQKALPSPRTTTDFDQEPRSQSVLSHQTAAPSYATHDYALGPAYPYQANPSPARSQPLPRRTSDPRIGTDSRLSSSSSRLPPSAFTTLIQPPASSLGNSNQFPLTSPPSDAFDPAMHAHRSTSMAGSTRTERTARGVRPLPTAPSARPSSSTSSARSGMSGARPLPRLPPPKPEPS